MDGGKVSKHRVEFAEEEQKKNIEHRTSNIEY
jgi:hypothetical protein